MADKLGDFLSYLLQTRDVGMSAQQAKVLLDIIQMKMSDKNNLEEFRILDLLPTVVVVRDGEKNTLNSSLGAAIDFVTGRSKEDKYKGQYDPDMFFSVIGLHLMLCEIHNSAKGTDADIVNKAEKIYRDFLSNTQFAASIGLSLTSISTSSIGHLDIFCPLLSIIHDSTFRTIEQSRQAYTFVIKSKMQPAFFFKKQ